jgi:hypothetical protein
MGAVATREAASLTALWIKGYAVLFGWLTIKESVMIFWLVLIVAGQVTANENPHTPRIMHVGNYSSYAACEKYAAGYTTPVKPSNNPPQITLLCIQANEPGRTQPPPG